MELFVELMDDIHTPVNVTDLRNVYSSAFEHAVATHVASVPAQYDSG